MDFTTHTLLIPEKNDVERDAVADAFTAAGGTSLRIGRFWDPPTDLGGTHIHVYGHDTFCLVLAQKLLLELISPDDLLVSRVPERWLGRDLAILPLEQAMSLPFPVFIKPATPKQFSATIYESRHDLTEECQGLDGSELIIRASIMAIQAEVRAFILDRQVLDVAVYEGMADPASARKAITEFCSDDIDLPVTTVLDFAQLQEGSWVFLEANASWGAGLNGCDAAKVLPAITAASNQKKSQQ